MVEKEKVRGMTRLAMYEKKEIFKDELVAQYQRRDYVRMEMLKTVLYTTVGYGILLLFLSVGRLEYLMMHAMDIDYGKLVVKIVAGYVVLLSVYLVMSGILHNRRYSHARRKMKEYDRNLHLLRQLQRKKE